MSDQPRSWPQCRKAHPASVLASAGIDLLALLGPLAVGMLSPLPAPVRLLLVVIALAGALTLFHTHCVYGRGIGAYLLGLRTVDDEAGLPPGSPRALLAVLHGGSTSSATVYNTRKGADPSRGSLASLSPSPTAEGTSPAEEKESRRSRRRAHKASSTPRPRRRAKRNQTPPAPALPPQGPPPPPPTDSYASPSYEAATNGYGVIASTPAAPLADNANLPLAPAAPAVPPPAPSPPAPPLIGSPQTTQYDLPPQTPALIVISPNGWEARITAATVVGRGPLPNPEHAAYATLAVPDLGRNCAANHIVLRPTMTGAEVTDLGSPTGTALLPPGAPPVFCPPGGTLAATPPFSLALGSLTLTIAQE
ncbi:Uncharacterised protein [Actinomyces bovis]|uniref:Uncharacterized protein n=1 Tax=Actinomyces bovis TaxID=1658 RepID=A0ABY1VQK4_9ACTO|nr:hypothetical protein [Actinomyces bovis]SPT54325.1 Uncharacterised protein [Actinomyces bovis]VEG56297.1 Uncharacterised protein [Actinomyces israelii]